MMKHALIQIIIACAQRHGMVTRGTVLRGVKKMPVCRVRDVAPAPRSSRKVLGVGDFWRLSVLLVAGRMEDFGGGPGGWRV